MSFGITQLVGFAVSFVSGGVEVPAADASWSFDANKSLVEDSSATTFSFTRESAGPNVWYYNSGGTYVTAAATTPRFDHDPASSNASRGMIVEGWGSTSSSVSNVNGNSYSWELTSGSWWTVTGIASSTITAPTGSAQAYAFYAQATTSVHSTVGSFQSPAGAGTGSTAWFMINARAVTGSSQRYFMLRGEAGSSGGNTVSATFDISNPTTGVIDSSGTLTKSFVQDRGNGWYRFGVATLFTGANTNQRTAIFLGDGPLVADHTGAWVGSGTSSETIEFFNAHQHLGLSAFADKVCSVADNPSKGDRAYVSTSNIPNFTTAAGTMYIEFEYPELAQRGRSYLLTLGSTGSSTTDYMNIFKNTAQDNIVFTSRRAASSTTTTFGTLTANAVNRAAMSWGPSGLIVAVNGSADTNSALTQFATGTAQNHYMVGVVNFGSFGNSLDGFFWARDVKMWGSQLTQEELAQLTTDGVTL